MIKFRKEIKEKWETQSKDWLNHQKNNRKRQFAAVHVWQGDPFRKKLHATDEIYKCLPRSRPAGSLSNLGFKNFKEEIFFEVCENNIRVFVFSKLRRSKHSVHKKIKKDLKDRKEILEKMEIWDFIEEFFKLMLIKFLEWDWENPNFNLAKECYDNTLSKFSK